MPILKNIEEKFCLTCGDKIKGRADKKFCSDDCRTMHHNLMNKDVSKFMKNINNILRKNRRILATLNPDGKSKVSKTHLLDEGFNFAYYTNEYRTKSGKVYHFCYEQGYLYLDDGWYALVIKQEYVDK
jgi:predicted nucleic acid-binding Zn ribbon protein